MKVLLWILINGFSAFCVWYGAYQGNEWATNVFKCMAWWSFSITLILYIGRAVSDDLKAALNKNKMSVPYQVSFAFDFIVALSLAALGWFGYATIVITQGIMHLGLYPDKQYGAQG